MTRLAESKASIEALSCLADPCQDIWRNYLPQDCGAEDNTWLLVAITWASSPSAMAPFFYRMQYTQTHTFLSSRRAGLLPVAVTGLI